MDVLQPARQMQLEQLLDLRHARATVDPVDDRLVTYEHEGRHFRYAESLDETRVRFRINASNVQPGALPARDVREEALHAARRPGGRLREEHQCWEHGV